MIPSYTTGSAVAASPSISPTLHWGHILSTLSPHPWSNPQIYLWDNLLQLKMCSGVFWVCCFIKVFFSTTVLFILLCTSTNYLSLVTPLLNYSPSLASSPFTNTFPLFLVETCKAVSFRHWSRLVLQHPFRHQLGLQTVSPPRTTIWTFPWMPSGSWRITCSFSSIKVSSCSQGGEKCPKWSNK